MSLEIAYSCDQIFGTKSRSIDNFGQNLHAGVATDLDSLEGYSTGGRLLQPLRLGKGIRSILALHQDTSRDTGRELKFTQVSKNKAQVRGVLGPQANLGIEPSFRLPEISGYGPGNQDEIVTLRFRPAKHLRGYERRYIHIQNQHI